MYRFVSAYLIVIKHVSKHKTGLEQARKNGRRRTTEKERDWIDIVII